MSDQPQPQKKKFLPRYRIGEVVYFHAFAVPDNQQSYFLCKGVILRPPIRKSPVYKIVVTSVDPKSVLCGHSPDLARRLVGKRIARKEHQLSPEIPHLIGKIYEGFGWLEVGQAQLEQIMARVRSLKDEQRKRKLEHRQQGPRKDNPSQRSSKRDRPDAAGEQRS